MNIKPPLLLIALILCAATHNSAWAQSGTITFQGRIVASVCSGTPITSQSWSNLPGEPRPAFSMDNRGCEHHSGSPIASTRLSGGATPAAQGHVQTQRTDPAQGSVPPVLTITYH